MLSWRRVALTFSLCGAPPRTRCCLTTAWKKCKIDTCPLGGQQQKTNRPVPLPAHGGGLGGKHDVLVRGDPSCPPPAASPRVDRLCSAVGRGRALTFQNQLCHSEVPWLGPSPCPLGLGFPIHTTGERAQKFSKTVLGSVEGLEAVRLRVKWRRRRCHRDKREGSHPRLG